MLKKVFLDLDQTLQKDIPIFQFVADCALRISLGYSKNRLKLNVGRCYKKFWILWYHFLFLSYQSVAILVIPTRLNAKNVFWGDNFQVFPTHNVHFIRLLDDTLRAGSCAIDFQTKSLLALNKKWKVNWKFQFSIFCQNTFGVQVNCTWSGPKYILEFSITFNLFS